MTDRAEGARPLVRSADDRGASRGRLRGGLIVALLAGLGLVTLLVAFVGLGDVADAVGAIGWGGFALFTLFWLPVMWVTGAAWAAAAHSLRSDRIWPFVWARFVRDSAADVLPFSQVGGLVFGARSLIAAGVPERVALASVIVDMTAELAAQFFYTLLGVGLIAVRLNKDLAGPVLWPALIGLALLFAAGAAVVLAQRRVVSGLGRVARRWLPDSIMRADAVSAALEEIYRHPGRVALAVTLHVGGWVGGAASSWVALRCMGAETPFWAVVAVESLMYALRNLGFALPGNLGVQEASYALLGPLFGVHSGDALALSLLRRARDLVIGLPVLAIWQWREGRTLLRRRRGAS